MKGIVSNALAQVRRPALEREDEFGRKDLKILQEKKRR
jgi:hypothetical protein